MNENKKERLNVRFSPELREKLKREKQWTGKTETAIIEDALCRYFEKDEQEAFINRFFEAFDERYMDVFARIQFAAGASDRNIQTLLNIKNTELFFNGLRPDNFMSVYETKHGIMSIAEKSVKQQISKSKQYKDNSRVDE